MTTSVNQLMQALRRGWGRVPAGVRGLSEASAIPGPQIADLKHKLMDGLEYYETIAASAVSGFARAQSIAGVVARRRASCKRLPKTLPW